MEWSSSLLGFMGRSILGIVLAPTLAGIGMILGRILYDFSGAISFYALFWSLMVGVGIGSGVGGFIAWLIAMDNSRPKEGSVGGLVIAVGVGLGAAVVGYEVGKAQEPTRLFTTAFAQPMAYSIFFSTLAANVAGILIAVVSGFVWRLPRPPFDLEINSPDRSPS